MRLDIYHHIVTDQCAESRILAAILDLSQKVEAMTQKLDEAIANANAAVTEISGELDSVIEYIHNGVPAIVAAAVSDALAAAGVAEDAAADAVNAAVDAVKAKSQATVDAITATPGEEPPVT